MYTILLQTTKQHHVQARRPFALAKFTAGVIFMLAVAYVSLFTWSVGVEGGEVQRTAWEAIRDEIGYDRNKMGNSGFSVVAYGSQGEAGIPSRIASEFPAATVLSINDGDPKGHLNDNVVACPPTVTDLATLSGNLLAHKTSHTYQLLFRGALPPTPHIAATLRAARVTFIELPYTASAEKYLSDIQLVLKLESIPASSRILRALPFIRIDLLSEVKHSFNCTSHLIVFNCLSKKPQGGC
eukprot:TRINITY_DN6884_c0_g1_i1.p1 TRINITY_DN6884_c0_g1~~TRINITY_DN6884_c0_g1_i1.p1  ORF type:complete len:240 (+),score=31.74 TRINITY_DN6884_c0_g1_i1:102-821(+)